MTFLVHAEATRRRMGVDGLHVILAMASEDEFHPNVLYDLDHKRWRLQNIVLPLCAMIPSVKKLTYCTSRNDLDVILDSRLGPLFPENYSPDCPFTYNHTGWNSLLALRGEEVQFLRASEQAKDYARVWFEAHNPTNSKNVVITLRESSFNVQRNTDFSLWMTLFRSLKMAGYNPVVMRDIETALLPIPAGFEDITYLTAPVFNLDLRLGFYEECFLHVSVNQGAASLGFYDKNVHFLHFMTDEQIGGTTLGWCGARHGACDPFLNKFQRQVWCGQSEKTMMREFTLLADYKSAEVLQNRFEENLAADPAHLEPMIDVASRYFDFGEWDLFSKAAEYVIEDEADNFQIYYLKGLAEIQKQTNGIGGDQELAKANLTKSLTLIEKLENVETLSEEVLQLKIQLVRLIG